MSTTSPLDPFFRFALGQEVTLKAMLTPFKVGTSAAYAFREVTAQKLMIVERTLIECPGGRQQTYTCRVLSVSEDWDRSSFTRDMFQLNEAELAPYPGAEGSDPHA
jgi:hypothetical protein